MNQWIKQLVRYGVERGLVQKEDVVLVTNQLLELLEIDSYEEPQELLAPVELEEILKHMLDYACEQGIIEDDLTHQDLFDTKIMGKLTPPPSTVNREFRERYQQEPKKATDYFYTFSQDNDYIRRYRILKDQKWETKTPYGTMEITINLSKPEKDPGAIAAERKAKPSGYPKCLICHENEGYAGRVNHPARQNHRVIPITIQDRPWGFQYSPYVYYNEHCIVFNMEHIPMKVDRNAFEKLLDFVSQFPHYFVGSNADLPIVGGSILSHDHFQGGNHTFAMAKAPVEESFDIGGYEDVAVGIVKWPMSVIRLNSPSVSRLVELADHILGKWRDYSDEEAFIYDQTDGEPHNTITPIARKSGNNYELDLVLRNNITTPEHPLGVFHPHSDLHHIKKENIGLIEVMGLAVLPARLKTEMELLRKAMLQGEDLEDERIAHHAMWAKEILTRYDNVDVSTIDGILKDEIGKVFQRVLEDAGVFKQDNNGRKYFKRFLGSI